MRIVVSGGTGFLGVPLLAALRRDGDTVVVLTRGEPRRPDEVRWVPDGSVGEWAHLVDGADAIVSLAGASIAGGRWTAARKRLLIDSRLRPVQSLATAIHAAAHPPRVFVAGSAIGYYGDCGDTLVTEARPAGTDFLARLTADWEAAAAPLLGQGLRVALIRTGLPLAPDGGVLGRMLLPFRLGLGGPFGRGTQYVPWIHRDDWVDLIRWVLRDGAADGAFNATAPEPVTHEVFSTGLARVLRRPHLLRVPAFALTIALGELAEALLHGQRAVPARAEALGFRMRWPSLEPALRDLLGNKQ